MSFQSQTFSSLKGPLFSFSIFFSSHCEWLRGLFFLLSAFIWSFHSLFHQVKMFLQYSWIQQQPRSGCRVLFWYCSSCWAPCSNRECNHSLEINGLELWGFFGVFCCCCCCFLWVEQTMLAVFLYFIPMPERKNNNILNMIGLYWFLHWYINTSPYWVKTISYIYGSGSYCQKPVNSLKDSPKLLLED